MGAATVGYSAAEERTKLAYKNRWNTLRNNPKILVIALFASYATPCRLVRTCLVLTLRL